MRSFTTFLSLFALTSLVSAAEWRSLPLIQDGKVHPDWKQLGWGHFAVREGTVRTECDARGLGLLVYQKEAFGDCQLKVVYRSQNAKSNSGVYVRIDEGILKVDPKTPPAERDSQGKLTEAGLERMKAASEQELGPWYAVHHGYEVQICDGADERHRTGAIYSLSTAAPASKKPEGEWRTMLITLKGTEVRVSIDGEQVSTFDSDRSEVVKDRVWYEPKREPKRPTKGYIGLQTHDPGDVVAFKEVSVRPLDPAAKE